MYHKTKPAEYHPAQEFGYATLFTTTKAPACPNKLELLFYHG
jgi:hypothetical protein